MIPFIGPSYQLDTRKADTQRSVNLFLKSVESGTGKARYILESVPGLDLFATLSGEVRGAFATVDGALYAVAGSTVYKISSAGTPTNLGTITTTTGPVDMSQNLHDLIVVDGVKGYVIDLIEDEMDEITDEDFLGADRVAVIDGYAIFNRPDTGQFYISGIDAASNLDALDFATAEKSPDDLVAVIEIDGELRLLGSRSFDVWVNTGATDFPFERSGAGLKSFGCAAAHTARRLAGSLIWLGSDEDGQGIVWQADGYTPKRISTHAVEDAISSIADLSGAVAYTYQDGGHAFWCLNVPGLATTWCYDVSTQTWHERADLEDGEYIQHRATCHAFAYGKHIVGAEDGKLYAFNRSTHTNDGDPLVRDRVSPHNATPDLQTVFFGCFELDATRGDAPSGGIPLVSMRYSNDGGRTWGPWRIRELGRIGEFERRARWLLNGSARDRVWQVRVTDNAPFSIISADVDAKEGAG
jgi:hypothetical protein